MMQTQIPAESPSSRRPFYRQTWFIILSLVFFMPLGIFLMIRYANWKPALKVTATLVAVLLSILFLVGLYNAPPSLSLSTSQASIIKTDESSYKITGRVSSLRATSLRINGMLTDILRDGSFTALVPLEEGDNTIKLEVTSSRGKAVEYLKIHRTTAEEFAERKQRAEEQVLAAEAEAAATQKTSQAQQVTPEGEFYTVTSIVDGDTIKVSINGVKTTIRLIGIDTPETSAPNKPVQCYGKEASSRMQHYVQSKKVRLESDSSQTDKDKYGRLLRYVYLEDGRNVAYEMIRGGYGKEYTYSKAYRYQSQFKEAERLASSEKLGLWAAKTCDGNTSQTYTAQVSTPTSTPTPSPAPTPAPAPAPAPTSTGCDPNYSPCVPIVSYDLDCGDIGFKVQVIGTDIHRFDGNRDGYGCEAY